MEKGELLAGRKEEVQADIVSRWVMIQGHRERLALWHSGQIGEGYLDSLH